MLVEQQVCLQLAAPVRAPAAPSGWVQGSDDERLQAWYREGCAARTLEQWENAAQAFFEAYRLDPGNADLAAAFQQAVACGQAAHSKQQPQQEQQ